MSVFNAILSAVDEVPPPVTDAPEEALFPYSLREFEFYNLDAGSSRSAVVRGKSTNVFDAILKFNPYWGDQPRDEQGRWAFDGAGAGATPAGTADPSADDPFPPEKPAEPTDPVDRKMLQVERAVAQVDAIIQKATEASKALLDSFQPLQTQRDELWEKQFETVNKLTAAKEAGASPEAIAVLQQEYTAREAELKKITAELEPQWEAYSRAKEAESAATEEGNRMIQNALAADPSSNRGLGGSFGKELKHGSEAVAFFNKVNGSDFLREGNFSVGQSTKSEREYFSNGAIYLRSVTSASVIVHEMGHVLEHSDRDVSQECQSFLARRTQGLKPESLNAIKGLKGRSKAFSDDEVGIKDGFRDPYVGKIYRHEATEVLSMGLQWLQQEPLRFFKEDPDHFKFTVRILNMKKGNK